MVVEPVVVVTFLPPVVITATKGLVVIAVESADTVVEASVTVVLAPVAVPVVVRVLVRTNVADPVAGAVAVLEYDESASKLRK